MLYLLAQVRCDAQLLLRALPQPIPSPHSSTQPPSILPGLSEAKLLAGGSRVSERGTNNPLQLLQQQRQFLCEQGSQHRFIQHSSVCVARPPCTAGFVLLRSTQKTTQSPQMIPEFCIRPQITLLNTCRTARMATLGNVAGVSSCELPEEQLPDVGG